MVVMVEVWHPSFLDPVVVVVFVLAHVLLLVLVGVRRVWLLLQLQRFPEPTTIPRAKRNRTARRVESHGGCDCAFFVSLFWLCSLSFRLEFPSCCCSKLGHPPDDDKVLFPLDTCRLDCGRNRTTTHSSGSYRGSCGCCRFDSGTQTTMGGPLVVPGCCCGCGWYSAVAAVVASKVVVVVGVVVMTPFSRFHKKTATNT